MELVTVKTFERTTDAHLLKATLSNRGVESVLLDDLINQVYPFAGNGALGIRLQVRKEDGSKAMEIIREIEGAPYTREDGTVVCCPKCQSLNIKNGIPDEPTNFRTLLNLIVALTIGLFKPSANSVYRCYDCKEQFE